MNLPIVNRTEIFLTPRNINWLLPFLWHRYHFEITGMILSIYSQKRSFIMSIYTYLINNVTLLLLG